MGWIGRAFGRALIYNTVREGFYQAHHQMSSSPPRTTGSSQRLRPANNEVLVQFVCPDGHHFTVPFHGKHPTSSDLVNTRCPECDEYARWLAIDYHIENAQ